MFVGGERGEMYQWGSMAFGARAEEQTSLNSTHSSRTERTMSMV